MTQLEIIPNEPVGRHRKHDPATSVTAARSVKPRLIESLVLETLRRVGPLTTHEIAICAGLPRDSISPRMCQLERRGLVIRTDQKRDGRIVWRLA